MENYREIGQRLKQLRGKLSMKEFARQLGISFAAYQNYEYGKRVPPGPVLQKIASLTHVTADFILTGDTAFLYRHLGVKTAELEGLQSDMDKLDDELRTRMLAKGIPVPADIGSFVDIISFYRDRGIDLLLFIEAKTYADISLEKKSLQIAEQCATFGEDSQLDNISDKILLLLKEMPDEDRRAILKNVEEKKLLHDLMEERKKLKDAG